MILCLQSKIILEAKDLLSGKTYCQEKLKHYFFFAFLRQVGASARQAQSNSLLRDDSLFAHTLGSCPLD